MNHPSGRWARADVADGVVVRRPVAEDAAGVLSVHGDRRTYDLDPDLTHRDLADSERFLAPILEHWQRYGFGIWTVLVPRSWWPDGVGGPLTDDGPDPEAGGDDLVHAGLGGVRHHRLVDEPVLNVYYRLAPAVQGRGVAGAVLRAAVTMAPTVAPGLPLVVRTRPANGSARRVAERAGFTDRGTEPGDDSMQLLRLDDPTSGARTAQR